MGIDRMYINKIIEDNKEEMLTSRVAINEVVVFELLDELGFSRKNKESLKRIYDSKEVDWEIYEKLSNTTSFSIVTVLKNDIEEELNKVCNEIKIKIDGFKAYICYKSDTFTIDLQRIDDTEIEILNLFKIDNCFLTTSEMKIEKIKSFYKMVLDVENLLEYLSVNKVEIVDYLLNSESFNNKFRVDDKAKSKDLMCSILEFSGKNAQLLNNTEIEVEQDGIELEQDGIEIEQDGIEIEQDGIELEQDGIEIEQDGIEIEQDEIEIEQDGIELEQDGIEIEQDGIEIEQDEIEVEQEEIEQDGIEVEQDGIEVEQEEIEQDGIEVEQDGIEVEQDGIEVEQDEIEVEQEEIEVESQSLIDIAGEMYSDTTIYAVAVNGKLFQETEFKKILGKCIGELIESDNLGINILPRLFDGSIFNIRQSKKDENYDFIIDTQGFKIILIDNEDETINDITELANEYDIEVKFKCIEKDDTLCEYELNFEMSEDDEDAIEDKSGDTEEEFKECFKIPMTELVELVRCNDIEVTDLLGISDMNITIETDSKSELSKKISDVISSLPVFTDNTYKSIIALRNMDLSRFNVIQLNTGEKSNIKYTGYSVECDEFNAVVVKMISSIINEIGLSEESISLIVNVDNSSENIDMYKFKMYRNEDDEYTYTDESNVNKEKVLIRKDLMNTIIENKQAISSIRTVVIDCIAFRNKDIQEYANSNDNKAKIVNKILLHSRNITADIEHMGNISNNGLNYISKDNNLTGENSTSFSIGNNVYYMTELTDFEFIIMVSKLHREVYSDKEAFAFKISVDKDAIEHYISYSSNDIDKMISLHTVLDYLNSNIE